MKFRSLSLLILAFLIFGCGIVKYSINGTLPYYLFLADRNNKRVLVWTSAPTTNQAAPDYVLGQADMTSSVNTVTQTSTDDPVGVASNGIQFAVLMGNTHRILLWNSIPTSNNQPADIVIGQANFTSSGRNAGAGISNAVTCGTGLAFPNEISFADQKIIVADIANNRVLIWNSFPTSNLQSADVVLGQPSMCVRVANSPTVDLGMSSPPGLNTDGTRLCVADVNNNRILIWNTIPTVNQTAPNIVLGQPDFTSVAVNNTPGAAGTVSSTSMSGPTNCRFINGRFFVNDNGNFRILVWNSVPTTNQQAADFVIGQPDFSSSTSNNGGVSARSLASAFGISSDGVRLYVTDSGNNRILVWNKIPNSTSQAADYTLGQSNLTSNSSNAGVGSTNALGINNPAIIYTNGSNVGVRRPEGY